MNTKKQSRREYMIQEALRYEAMGLSVMPLGAITKDSKGKKDITYVCAWKIFQTVRATPVQINAWRATNLGIVTGPVSDLLVLDLDSYKQGYDHKLEKSLKLSVTPTAHTASGGKQLFYKWPDGLEIRNDVCIGHEGSGIDVRAAGGMVIAPPSRTTYGEYTWLIDPFDTPLAEVPPNLLEMLTEKVSGSSSGTKGKRKKMTELIGLKEGGGRNNAIASFVGKLLPTVDPKKWAKEVWPAVQEVNSTYKPPMDMSELRNIYESITKIELKRRANMADSLKNDYKKKTAEPIDTSPSAILDRIYNKDPKSLKSYELRLMVYAFIFLDMNPYLRVTKEGQFYDYSQGVYRAQTNLEMRNRVFRALTSANLGDLASPSAVGKILAQLMANAPSMVESDTDVNVLNLKNGLLDISSMVLLPHTPNHVSTAQSPASYEPDATCNRWRQFLSDVTKNDMELIEYLQETVGYCTLTNDTSHHAAFFIYGPGGNGKGTFTRIISSLVDPNLLYHATVEQITGRFGGAMMIDKRLVILDEPNIKEFRSEVFRKYISGEPSFAEKKGVTDMIPFTPRARFICTTNEPPRYDEANDANSRRFHLIPFTNKFEGTKLVLNLAETIITEERDGILLWAIDGLKRLRARGSFSRPEIVRREQKIIGRNNSSAHSFFHENFAVTHVEALYIAIDKNEMYSLYVTFCQRDGYTPKSSARFVSDMKLIPNIKYKMDDDRVVEFTNLMPLGPLQKLQELKDSLPLYVNRRRPWKN